MKIFMDILHIFKVVSFFSAIFSAFIIAGVAVVNGF